MTRPVWPGIVIVAALFLILVNLTGCGGGTGLSRVPGDESSRVDRSSGDQAVLPADTSDEEVALEPDSGADRELAADSGAEDSEIWRSFESAEEYYSMGVIANRESSWEEAQYYFEKALKVLANVDVAMDSTLTPEAVKYSTLLDNIVSDYRVTLRSLGRLDEDAAPSAIIERFGDLEGRLGRDSMRVYKSEGSRVSYDLPVVLNDRVRKSIVYFQTVANEAFTRYLSRSRKYFGLFSKILAQNGLPSDLVYLSLVESGYNPHAYSWARAMGLWQFIASTGQLYGLNRNWWVDERKDPVKSTQAAARFLKDLYDQFGNWELAMAAYNGGPGRVERTIADQHTSDFWKMRLRQQTMDYVPLIYAAIIIGKEPAKYGFGNIQYEPELSWDSVAVGRCLDLKTVADALGYPVDTLKGLNPELLRSYTPPNTQGYMLKIPKGTTQKFWAAYDEMPSPKESSFAKHKVKRRETLASIAGKYGVSQYAILEANNLPKGTKIKAGRELIIPSASDHDRSYDAPDRHNVTATNGVYTVRPGDTVWDIARALGVTVDELRRVNYLERGSRIYIGQQLKVPSYALTPAGKTSRLEDRTTQKPASKPSTTVASAVPVTPAVQSSESSLTIHTVRAGDTIWDIARKYGISAEQIRSSNGLTRSSRIHIGQQLIIQKGAPSNSYVIYQVRDGDTLSRIAQKYRTSIEKIIAANSLSDPSQLKIGDRIKIYVD